MSSIALVAIVIGALVTVLAVAAVATIVTQRVGRAIDDATTAAQRLTAASAAIGEQQRINRRELDRLHSSLEQVHRRRHHGRAAAGNSATQQPARSPSSGREHR
ncbi:MAG: hypothetical protein R6V28_12020 [Nitriliruptoraceae bacterium]